MRQFWTICSMLSLDVAAGAVATASLAVWWMDKPMPWVWWVVLPLSVWVIYTADHLLDAHRLKEKAHTDRHLFHFHYFSLISLICVCVFTGILLIAWEWLPLPLWYLGVGMGLLVLVHFGLVRWVGDRTSWFILKEGGVGGIYTAGVWGGPILMYPECFSVSLGLLLVQLFGLVMFNLLTFSMYECDIDEIDGHTSFVRAIGVSATRWLLLGISGLIGILGVIASLSTELSQRMLLVQGVFFMMLVILLLVAFGGGFFLQNLRYRRYGDSIFLIPALIWWW